MNLLFLPVGACARVKALHNPEHIRRRLLDIGLTKGAEIECLFENSAGDLKAYSIRGATIALRAEDAREIELSKEGYDGTFQHIHRQTRNKK